MKNTSSKSIAYPYVQKTPYGKVKIYRNLEGDRVRYVVAWVTEEGRQRAGYVEEEEAHQRAQQILDDYRRGVSLRSGITSSKAVVIAEYERLLAAYNATLEEAVRFYLNHCEKQRTADVGVGLAVRQYLESFETKDSRNYESVRAVVNTFADKFTGRQLAEVTVEELDKHLRSVSPVGRTRNNHLKYLKMFFRWCQNWKGYLLGKELIVDKIPAYAEVHSKPEVFTPEEIEKLLNAADSELLPYLAIGAFAGIRCAELARLKWCDVDLEHRIITLDSQITKTKRRRVVDISDNLAEWLKSVDQHADFHVVPFSESLFLGRRAQLCKAVGVKWKANGLRKSFISYRMAQSNMTAEMVAKQCGNSPEMVEQNYKGLVIPKAAEAWFSVLPSSYGKADKTVG